MTPRIPDSPRVRATIVASTTVAVAAAVALSLTVGHSATTASPVKPAKALGARLISSFCGGPAGAAYVSDSGWDGFSAINTANCDIIQTYNVGDPQVPGDPGDYDYASTNEGLAIHGSTLYFADTGNDGIAIINAATLNPKNYNPAETDIHTGLFPEELAVTPDGKQLWVANTGPQTAASSPTSVSVINTATKKVVRTLAISGAPSAIAFSPNGAAAYVLSAHGLTIFSTITLRAVRHLVGLGDPRSLAVAPNGTLYVTDTSGNSVKVINPGRDQIRTSDNSVVGSLNLGTYGAQSGDGYGPNGIVLTKTPTPGS